MSHEKNDFDVLIIGSGFGGSVSALRLAEKGYRVAVLERGRRFQDQDFPKTNWDLKNFLWFPLFKFFGIQNLSLFRHVLILTGSGVGGGSLVYANTLLRPKKDFYVKNNLESWEKSLEPHYDTAEKMLGVAVNPRLTEIDHKLKEISKELGFEKSFAPARVGVCFEDPSSAPKDPYFQGEGPLRSGCIFCGGCMVGCRHNAKNTLVKNYLYFAEKKGVQIIPNLTVDGIRKIEGGYEVDFYSSKEYFFKKRKKLRAQKVILSGGVLGTLKILFRCRDELKTLPLISKTLGQVVRTNSESLLGVSQIEDHPKIDCSEGIAISSIFHADSTTHIEPVRYPKGSDLMRFLAGPLADGENSFLRALKMLIGVLLNPMEFIKIFLQKNWAGRTAILLVMQDLENALSFQFGRSVWNLFQKGLISKKSPYFPMIKSYIPVAHQVAKILGKKINAVPQNSINEVLLGIPTTAHVLGGCSVAQNPEMGVIDENHEVFHYPGLYVCDGSAIPANLGVNPSLTITAMTERAMSKWPHKLA